MHDACCVSTPSIELVFGLSWFPVLSRSPERTVRQMAYRHRATHRVVVGSPVCAAGFARLDHVARAGVDIHAAAQVVATIFPQGTVALILPMQDQRQWLVVVHEGVVVARTDRFLTSSEEVDQVLHEIQRAFPALQILGQPGAPVAPDLDQLIAGVSVSSLMRKTPRQLPYGKAGAGLLICVAGWLAYWSTDSGHVIPSAPSHSEPLLSPLQAWEQAIRRSIQSQAVHGVQGLHELQAALMGLPVHLGGWAMTQWVCQARHAQWHCQADIRRVHRLATNATLFEQLPAGWGVSFVSLDQATLEHVFQVNDVPLHRVALQGSHYTERVWLSVLQSVRPAFGLVHVGVSTPLPLEPPRDETQQWVERPPELLPYARRAIRVQGPLRSLVLLTRHAQAIRWNRLRLTVHEAVVPDVRTSHFVIDLEGELYEHTEASHAS